MDIHISVKTSLAAARISLLAVILTVIHGAVARGGEWPREMHIYKGSTPVLDGMIGAGEYSDAVAFEGVQGWTSQFNPTTDDEDLSLKGWAKHDGQAFYFAFHITDDVLYGIDTERWLPDENDRAHALTPEGFPWFGDGLELMLNAAYEWRQEDEQYNAGDGTSWQMVCNLTKSRLGGVGVGGLLEGEQRTNPRAWRNYGDWIRSGAMKAAARPDAGGGGYTIEWSIQADPCVEVTPGVFWSAGMGDVRMGFNVSVQDLDRRERGEGNWGNFNYEDWWAGERDRRTWLKQWGTLVVHPGLKPLEVHVSPDGSDGDPGTAEAPLKSLEAARDTVRNRSAAGLGEDILVVLHEGIYRLDRAFVLGPEDSGSEEHSITWTSAPAHEWPGDAVRITGHRPVEGWRREGDDVWSTRLPEVAAGDWWFRDLFTDGRRLTRARFPNAGEHLRIQEVSGNVRDFEFDRTLPDFNTETSDAELVTILHWAIDRGRVTSASATTVQTATPMGFLEHGACTTRAGEAAFLEHSRAFLDQPGEWYLDRSTGRLWYKAESGQNPNDLTFEAPRLEQLVVIAGTRGSPVRNVHFRGIDFTGASWKLPAAGYRGIQAAHYGTVYEKEPTYAVPVALRFAHWHDGSFRFCRVRQTGASGLGLAAGCRRNTVQASEFADIGANGVMIGWRGVADKPPRLFFDTDWPDPADVPTDNRILDCSVHQCGTVAYGAVGIFDAFTESSRIAHNAVHSLPYTGVSIGFRWDTTTSTHCSTQVEYNHIWDVMGVLADGGGVYTLGWQPDTVLRGNLIHHVHRSEIAHGGAPNNGFFFDQGSKGYLVEGNIVFEATGAPTRFNQSQHAWHTWSGNALGVMPTSPVFPWNRAALAGPRPAFAEKVRVLSRRGRDREGSEH